MTSHRVRKLLTAGLIATALTAAPFAATAHTGRIGTSVTLKAGYGFFTGKVGSPLSACRVNRTVKLFKDVAGTDPLLKSTTTNSTGDWAIFRAYEVATFYVKVPARTIRRTGHAHMCKARTSLLVPAPYRVTSGDGYGWGVTQYDCLEYQGNPGGAQPLNGDPLVPGPGTPPMGLGSLRLTNPDAPLGFSFSFVRWNSLGGEPLADVRSITFSTYMDDDTSPVAPPPTFSLFVDVNGDGSEHEEITFSPPSASVVANRWQKWTAGSTSTWDTPGGSMTLSAYRTAHPAAQLDNSVDPWQFRSDCADAGTVPHYLDAVILRLTDYSLAFDFEP